MYTKPSNFIKYLLYTVLGVLILWACVSYVLPWTAPVLIAFALAALLEPAVRRLVRRRFPRAVASGLCTAALLGGTGALVVLAGGKAVEAASGLSSRLPELFQQLIGVIESLEIRLSRFMASAPEGVEDYIESALASLTESLAALPSKLSGRLLELLSRLLGSSPTVVLFAVTLGIGVYFISASYPSVTGFVKRQIPEAWKQRAGDALTDLKRALGGWLRAQLILMAITFCELAIALTLLRVNYALLLAVLTAFIDALPVLGAGTVLIPWAIVCFISGSLPRAVGLLVTYAAVMLLRNCIQAKLLGDQLGLHPVVTLIAIYAGWRIWGVWGMLLFPILAITAKQLNDRDVLRLWK